MSDHDSTLCPIWDATESHSLAFLKYQPELVDYAITIGGGLHGVSFALFEPADFNARFGVPPQPLQPPGDAIGNAVQVANWTVRTRKFEEQSKHLTTLRKVLLTIPQELLEPLKDEYGSLVMRTTVFIMNHLRAAYGTLSQPDLDSLFKRLSEKYDLGKPLPAFISKWKSTLRDLARAGQPLPSSLARQTLQDCFGAEFTQCWIDFVKDVPIVANRTVPRLCEAIVQFGKDQLPLMQTKTMYGANQALEVHALQQEIKMLKEDMRALAVAAQGAPVSTPSFPTSNPRNRKRGATIPDAGAKHAKTAPQPFSTRPFCWTHGPCKHLGSDCEGSEPGHKTHATWKNQLGSMWKTYFQSRGWSTISPT